MSTYLSDPTEDTDGDGAGDRRQKLIEVASMIDEFGLTLAEAEELVCITVGSDPLPSQRAFCPPPDWLAELCAEVRETWTPEERERRRADKRDHSWKAPDIDTRGLFGGC